MNNSKDTIYAVVRTRSAGVFAGFIEARKNDEIVLTKARRLWYWEGAASLSELAMRGVKYPDSCKFPVAVEEVTLLEVIEIIPTRPEAQKSIEEVPEWTAY